MPAEVLCCDHNVKSDKDSLASLLFDLKRHQKTLTDTLCLVFGFLLLADVMKETISFERFSFIDALFQEILVQVDNYEIIVTFFHISQNLT